MELHSRRQIAINLENGFFNGFWKPPDKDNTQNSVWVITEYRFTDVNFLCPVSYLISDNVNKMKTNSSAFLHQQVKDVPKRELCSCPAHAQALEKMLVSDDLVCPFFIPRVTLAECYALEIRKLIISLSYVIYYVN